ncbi:hypothetical protein G9A89_020451 [Geosiphon pyriformis]|nr:hypothetical protein G9A89_020451 [Geosiphon pyriformis]
MTLLSPAYTFPNLPLIRLNTRSLNSPSILLSTIEESDLNTAVASNNAIQLVSNNLNSLDSTENVETQATMLQPSQKLALNLMIKIKKLKRPQVLGTSESIKDSNEALSSVNNVQIAAKKKISWLKKNRKLKRRLICNVSQEFSSEKFMQQGGGIFT